MDMGMQPEEPIMDSGMQNQMPMGDAGMQEPDMMGNEPMGNADMGGNPNTIGDDGTNQFANDFDAGVEADEETDPKRYIQQLTGKLSTKLNSFNSENGNDEGLSKYVGKMIVKQAAKGLDDAGKKELIAAINSASSDNSDIEEPEDEISGDSEMDMGQDDMQQLQECCFTKKELRKLSEGINQEMDRVNEPDRILKKTQKKVNKTFSGK